MVSAGETEGELWKDLAARMAGDGGAKPQHQPSEMPGEVRHREAARKGWGATT